MSGVVRHRSWAYPRPNRRMAGPRTATRAIECNRLDQFHRGDPDLPTRRGVDDVQQPDDDEPGRDGDGDRERRDDPATVGLVLLDRVDHPRPQVGARFDTIVGPQGIHESLLDVHSVCSSRDSSAASPRRQWVLTEFVEMCRVSATSAIDSSS